MEFGIISNGNKRKAGDRLLLKYKTFKDHGEAEIIEKKSRFIASTAVVYSEEEAQAFIASVRKTYNNASHHVFAYRIEAPVILERQSDDGEPSGTAGKPILDLLRGSEIINGVIVVTRYFGGTLLGTGGLVRAYGHCAKAGIEAAGIIEKILFQAVHVKVDYTLSGKIQYEILQQEKHIKDTVYTDSVEYLVLIEKPETEGFIKNMTDISSGACEIALGEEIYGGFWHNELILFS